jgi:hypothetical protein
MLVRGSSHPLLRAIERNQHRSTRDATSSYRAETGGFGPHSGAKLLLTRNGWRDRDNRKFGRFDGQIWHPTSNLGRRARHGETLPGRHAPSQTLATSRVPTKKAQALNLSLIR